MTQNLNQPCHSTKWRKNAIVPSLTWYKAKETRAMRDTMGALDTRFRANTTDMNRIRIYCAGCGAHLKTILTKLSNNKISSDTF